MKFFKKLVGACLALTFCFSMAAMVSCGGKDGGDGSSTDGGNTGNPNAYNFAVYNADSTPATGYYVQMCTTDGEAICYQPTALDENGKVSITQSASACPQAAVYEVHILDSAYEAVATTETVYTPAQFSAEYIVITLAE